jgi:hypothetical protein
MRYPEKYLKTFEAKGKLQLNLAHDPKHTYIFDEYNKNELETMLDKIKFFSDLELGVTMSDFVLQEHHVSQLFVPVGTFHDENEVSSNDEFVAAIEGVVYPWFGIAYRIDRIQYSMEQSSIDKIDHSREAILHAQRIANLFIDEARLSANRFDFVADEVKALNEILNNDAYMMSLPLIASDPNNLIRTEVILF